MKKKEYKKLVMQQAKTIQRLQMENNYLRSRFKEARDFLSLYITKLLGEAEND